jgi:hypothetical protein
LHRHRAFTGQNVTAKKAGSKPNLEFVTENTDKLPSRTELFELYARMREMWNGERIMPTTETILKHPKTQATPIYTPPLHHSRAAIAAWQSGEKPLCVIAISGLLRFVRNDEVGSQSHTRHPEGESPKQCSQRPVIARRSRSNPANAPSLRGQSPKQSSFLFRKKDNLFRKKDNLFLNGAKPNSIFIFLFLKDSP